MVSELFNSSLLARVDDEALLAKKSCKLPVGKLPHVSVNTCTGNCKAMRIITSVY